MGARVVAGRRRPRRPPRPRLAIPRDRPPRPAERAGRSSTRHGWRRARANVWHEGRLQLKDAHGNELHRCVGHVIFVMRDCQARDGDGGTRPGLGRWKLCDSMGGARAGRYELLFWLDEGPALPQGPGGAPAAPRGALTAPRGQPMACSWRSRWWRTCRVRWALSSCCPRPAAARVVEPAAPLHSGRGGQPGRATRDEEARGGHADRGVAVAPPAPPAASTSASARFRRLRGRVRDLAVRCAVPGVDRAHCDAQRRARAALALAARDRRRGRRRGPLPRLVPGARLAGRGRRADDLHRRRLRRYRRTALEGRRSIARGRRAAVARPPSR